MTKRIDESTLKIPNASELPNIMSKRGRKTKADKACIDLNEHLFLPIMKQINELRIRGYSWEKIATTLNISLFKLRHIRNKYSDLPIDPTKPLNSPIIDENAKTAKEILTLNSNVTVGTLKNNFLDKQQNATLEQYEKIAGISTKEELCDILDIIANNENESTMNRANAIKMLSDLMGYSKQDNLDQPNYIVQFVEYIPNKTYEETHPNPHWKTLEAQEKANMVAQTLTPPNDNATVLVSLEISSNSNNTNNAPITITNTISSTTLNNFEPINNNSGGVIEVQDISNIAIDDDDPFKGCLL